MTELTITAKRWAHGWELWKGEECWTQVASLPAAVQQVRDYLDTVEPDTDHTDWVVHVVPELGALGADVAAARAATDAAADASREAARRSREVVRELRAEGYSVADTAAILGVSRGRISQLAHG